MRQTNPPEDSLTAETPGSGAGRYALILPLPPEIGLTLGEQMEGVPGATVPPLGYHVTILGPFVFRADPQVGLSLLRKALLSTAPFAVNLQRLGYFRQANENVLFIHVDGSAELMRLHNRLLAELGERITDRHPRGEDWDLRQYTPHVSLGLHIPDATLDAALRRLSDFRPAYAVHVRELWLLHETADSPSVWVLAESYHLA